MRHVSQKKLTMFIKAAEILSIATACYNKLQITGARISYLMKKLLTERKLQLLISFAIIQTHNYVIRRCESGKKEVLFLIGIQNFLENSLHSKHYH